MHSGTSEACIKARVLAELRAQNRGARGLTVASEVFVNRRVRRADLIAVTNVSTAFEVKSAADTLHRLHPQVAEYQKCFDRVVVVAAEKHLRSVMSEAAAEIGIWLVGSGEITVVREPAPTNSLCAAAIAEMLRKPDLCRLAASKGISTTDRATMIETCTLAELRSAMLGSFSEKYGHTSREFWHSLRGREVQPHHIARLSKSHKSRQLKQRQKKADAEFWTDWSRIAAHVFGAPGQPDALNSTQSLQSSSVLYKSLEGAE